MTDCNILLLNCQLQEAYDAHQGRVVGDLLNEEQGIHTRSVLMHGLIRDLRKTRIDKKEEDRIALDQDIRDRINEFRGVHWPNLEKMHTFTDDHNPFPHEVTNEVLGKEIDHMLDCLSTLLEQEQNTLSHVARDVKEQMDLGFHLSNMTSERAKHNPSRMFVANQKTKYS